MPTDPDRTEIARWIERDMLENAARGLGKVDRLGSRGLTLVTCSEIDAMATALACFGLVPIEPGDPPPETLVVQIKNGEQI